MGQNSRQLKEVDIMEKKEKKESAEESAVTVSVTSGAFPLKLWKEWDADCKENFGDVRWLKMWNDHLMAKRFEKFMQLFDEYKTTKDMLEHLLEQMNEEEEKQEDKKTDKVVKTFTEEISE